jgi:hypothetical protein
MPVIGDPLHTQTVGSSSLFAAPPIRLRLMRESRPIQLITIILPSLCQGEVFFAEEFTVRTTAHGALLASRASRSGVWSPRLGSIVPSWPMAKSTMQVKALLDRILARS